MNVPCRIELATVSVCNRPVASTVAKCSRCGHQVTSYGKSDASLRRCLGKMREECPRGEINSYHAGAMPEVKS